MNEEGTSGNGNLFTIIKDAIIAHPLISCGVGLGIGLGGAISLGIGCRRLSNRLKAYEDRLKTIESKGIPVTLRLEGRLKNENVQTQNS